MEFHVKNNDGGDFLMDTNKLIIASSKEYYNALKKDEYSRFRSWEHCYSYFCHIRGNQNVDIDRLSLQLAFYLASWGMYRGSGFLLQKDYRVHTLVVREIIKSKYNPLSGIECSEIMKESNLELLCELSVFIRNHYDGIRKEVKGHKVTKLSEILITKILLGTLGCVPAFDRYFKAGVKNQNISKCNYNRESALSLAKFYNENTERLEAARKNMTVDGFFYPQMKILDMGFWQIGFDLEAKSKEI